MHLFAGDSRLCQSMATHIRYKRSKQAQGLADVRVRVLGAPRQRLPLAMSDQLERAQAVLLQSRGAQLVVLNPGSARLRVGRAAAEAPLEVDHVASYLRAAASTNTQRLPLPTEAAVDDELETTCRQASASAVPSRGSCP